MTEPAAAAAAAAAAAGSSTGIITFLPIIFITVILFIIVKIILKKKHGHKIHILTIFIASIVLLFVTAFLSVEKEISANSQIILFIVSGLMMLGAFVWCFINPNKIKS